MPQQTITLALGAISGIATLDLDMDMDPELVVTSSAGAHLSLFDNDGTGVFAQIGTSIDPTADALSPAGYTGGANPGN